MARGTKGVHDSTHGRRAPWAASCSHLRAACYGTNHRIWGKAWRGNAAAGARFLLELSSVLASTTAACPAT